MEKIKLHGEICDDYMQTLKEMNEAWFYGYHVSQEDFDRYEEALDYLTYNRNEIKRMLKLKTTSRMALLKECNGKHANVDELYTCKSCRLLFENV